MKKLFCLFTLISIFAIQGIAAALTNEHNLSRWTTASSEQKTGVVNEMLVKAKSHGVLLVPYRDAADKKDAQQQLINCIDSIAKQYPGHSVGAGALACCGKMGYLNL